jgi:acyl-CoA thioester hydrolase
VRASLQPSTDPDDYPFAHRIRTRFGETDAMGVIHHGSYAAYLEEARVALLVHSGFPYERVRAEGVDFAVLELHVRFRKPLYFGDAVDISVVAGALTRATFQLAYLLQVEGETRSTAVTVHGGVDPGGRPVRLPGWLTEAFPLATSTASG